MSRKTIFFSVKVPLHWKDEEDFKKLELTMQGLKFGGELIISQLHLWDLMVDLMSSIPKNTSNLALARRHEEAIVALQERVKTLQARLNGKEI